MPHAFEHLPSLLSRLSTDLIHREVDAGSYYAVRSRAMSTRARGHRTLCLPEVFFHNRWLPTAGRLGPHARKPILEDRRP